MKHMIKVIKNSEIELELLATIMMYTVMVIRIMN